MMYSKDSISAPKSPDNRPLIKSVRNDCIVKYTAIRERQRYFLRLNREGFERVNFASARKKRAKDERARKLKRLGNMLGFPLSKKKIDTISATAHKTGMSAAAENKFDE